MYNIFINKMKTLLTVFVIIYCVQSDSYSISLSCSPCQNNLCLVLNGGPFNNQEYTLFGSSLQQVGLPVQCPNSQVPNGLQGSISVSCLQSTCFFSDSGITNVPQISLNASTQQGIIFNNLLNSVYGVMQKDRYAIYDWCGNAGCGLNGASNGGSIDCGQSSSKLGLILGIVFGLVGLGLIVGIVFFCYKKTQNSGQYSGNDTSRTGEMKMMT